MKLFHSLLFSFLTLLSFYSQAQNITVVTDRAHPVFNVPANAKIIYLDDATGLEEAISQGMSADPKQAASIAMQRLADVQFQNALVSAYQHMANAYSLGILKIPAVIVIDKYVVYGQTDVQQALKEIQRYREMHP